MHKAEKLRDNIINLAGLQNLLRTAVSDFQKQRGLGSLALVRVLKVGHKSLYKLLNKNQPLCGEQTLKRIGEAIGNSSLTTSIIELVKAVPDRYVGMTTFSTEAINTTLDIHEAYRRCADRLSSRQFVSLFGGQSKVVTEALRNSREGMTALEDLRTRTDIKAILNKTSWSVVQPPKITEEVTPDLELKELFEKALRVYKSKKAVAAAVDLHHQTLGKVLAGKARPRYIEKARSGLIQLLKKHKAEPTEPTEVPVSPREEKGEPVVTAPGILQEFGGETSPLGVKFVLGPKSFQELDFKLGEQFISLLKQEVEITRGLLNIVSKHQNPQVRKRIQKIIGEEVEELERAIRLFTSEFPNRLTSLYQAQRETWFQDLTIPSRRKGKNNE